LAATTKTGLLLDPPWKRAVLGGGAEYFGTRASSAELKSYERCDSLQEVRDAKDFGAYGQRICNYLHSRGSSPIWRRRKIRTSLDGSTDQDRSAHHKADSAAHKRRLFDCHRPHRSCRDPTSAVAC